MQLQVRTYPSIHAAVKKIAIDRALTLGELLSSLVIKDVKNKLDGEPCEKLPISASERMTAKINFDCEDGIWREFTCLCREKRTTPTARALYLQFCEIKGHPQNYLN